MYEQQITSILSFVRPPARVSMSVAKLGVRLANAFYYPTNSFENFLVHIVLWVNKPTHLVMACVHWYLFFAVNL